MRNTEPENLHNISDYMKWIHAVIHWPGSCNEAETREFFKNHEKLDPSSVFVCGFLRASIHVLKTLQQAIVEPTLIE